MNVIEKLEVLADADAQGLHHELGSAVGAAGYPRRQEEPLDVVAAVEPDGKVGQFPRGEGRAHHDTRFGRGRDRAATV